LPKNDSGRLEFTSNGRIFPKLNASVSATFSYSQIDATALGISGLQFDHRSECQAQARYRPTTGDSAQISFTRLTSDNPAGIRKCHQPRKSRLPGTAGTGLDRLGHRLGSLYGQRFQRLSTSPTFTQEYQRTVPRRISTSDSSIRWNPNQGQAAEFEYEQPG